MYPFADFSSQAEALTGLAIHIQYEMISFPLKAFIVFSVFLELSFHYSASIGMTNVEGKTKVKNLCDAVHLTCFIFARNMVLV